MVTTFNPPARARKPVKKSKPKPPTQLIALGIACVVLLVLVFMFIGKTGKANDRANMLSESVIETASILGAEGVTPELLADAETAPEVLEIVRVAATEQAADIVNKTAELEQTLADITRLQGELASAQEAASDAQSQANSASGDLRKRDAELQALQAKYDKDVGDLNAEIASIKSEVEAAAVEIKAELAESADGDEEETEELVVEESATGELIKGKPESSIHFTSYEYDTAQSNLLLRAGSSKVVFSEVPVETFEAMTTAISFDLFFRFRLMDEFPSKPDAREFIINLNK